MWGPSCRSYLHEAAAKYRREASSTRDSFVRPNGSVVPQQEAWHHSGARCSRCARSRKGNSESSRHFGTRRVARDSTCHELLVSDTWSNESRGQEWDAGREREREGDGRLDTLQSLYTSSGRAGQPTTVCHGATSRVTTAPAPTQQPCPKRMPGRMVSLAPTDTSDSTIGGSAL